MLDDFVPHVVERRLEYDTSGVVDVTFIDNRDHVKADASAYACTTPRELRHEDLGSKLIISPNECP